MPYIYLYYLGYIFLCLTNFIMPYKGIIINFPNVLLPQIYNVMFRDINILGQGVGILFRSVKLSVLLSLLSLNQCSVTRS